MAADHGISIGTVRRAMAALVARGMVVTLPAKGTFVTPEKNQDACPASEAW